MFGSLAILILLLCNFTELHITKDKSHLEQLQKHCEHANTCFHDTVPVCGKSVNEARTFLDLCDMFEFSCQYNMVYKHAKEEAGCPNPNDLAV